MPKNITLVVLCILFHLFSFHAWADSSGLAPTKNEEQAVAELANGAPEMLASLLELQQNLKEQLRLSQNKLRNSKSEAEKIALKEEIAQLDRQFSETTNDFERIATGVEPALFSEKKPATFSWKDEVTSLVEPAIKELKRFTIRARQKSDLKDKIVELRLLESTARQAVVHLQAVLEETADKEVQREVKALQPEWINVEKRLGNKLELANRELAQLEEQEFSLVESSSDSLRKFFRNRGLYLGLAILVFFVILMGCRLLYRGIAALSSRLSKKRISGRLKSDFSI